MKKGSFSSQRDLLTTALRALLVLLLLRSCDTTLSNIDLSTTTLDPASTGFMMTGNAYPDYFGISVKTAGDINKDGFEDILVGADGKSMNKGVVYVIYGGSTSSMSNLDFSSGVTLDPATTGFMIIGNGAKGHFGHSVSSAGDINGDGYDDIIIGAYGKDTNSGVAYVIYGGPNSKMSNIDLGTITLDPAATGFTITGPLYSYFGLSVSTAGDINNDGYDDIIVGARGKDDFQGAAYVVYGGPKSAMSNINLTIKKLDPAKTGFVITGNAVNDQFGQSVSTAGDINHDGYDDIIVGAWAKGSQKGAAYVIYGGPKSSMTNIDLSKSALNPLSTGFMISGNAAGDTFGWSVSTAGDINNDGYGDIVVGAHQKNEYQGAAYVIYGGPSSSRSNIDLSSTALDPATTGFKVTGNAANDWFGESVSTARDINHDGYSDIIIGAWGTSLKTGTVYVIYGGPTSSMSNIDLSSTTLNPSKTGFTIAGNEAGDQLGCSVSTTGDINHDGYDDIVVGAAWKDSEYGVAYVIYGGPKSEILLDQLNI